MAFSGGISTVASRYSVLKIEGDDETNKKVPRGNDKKNEMQKFLPVKTNKKKKKKSDLTTELQNIAFCRTKEKKSNNPKNKKHIENDIPKEQWEEWIKKDSEMVTEAYEQDLQQALLLSKIEFEEKNMSNDGVSKSQKKKEKKAKEKLTLSLNEFNKTVANHESPESIGKKRMVEPLTRHDDKLKKAAVDNSKFVDKLVADVNRIISKEMQEEEMKKLEFSVTHIPRIMQYKAELEKKDQEIAALKLQVENLKVELQEVRIRNKQLCNIIAQGEMKGKVDILMQVEELTTVKDELTEQVSNLHALLEQERSKVHSMKIELAKYQPGKHSK